MRKASIVIVLLLVPFVTTVVVLPMATPVDAWGLVSHIFIDSEAMAHISNQSWAAAFAYYAPEVLGGSTTPDQAWQDWDNHLYYPETGEYNAPGAASNWFDFAKNNFTAAAMEEEGETANELWEKGFFAAGVMSHYAADPCIPVHTDDVEDAVPDLPWPGHAAYESEINAKFDLLTLETPTESIITNVSQLVVDCAVYSHQYFDDIAEAYPSSDSTALSNPTIRTITENCLSLAIESVLSLFYTLTLGINAPNVTITYDYVALFDYAHSNDYTDGGLTSVNQTLIRDHFEMKTQDSAFTASALADVNLLIVTCGFDSYSADELTAITNWAASGNKSILITGRGDFEEAVDSLKGNQILEAVGSHIRINDDNVYMEGTYAPWYNDLMIIPDSSETLGLTELVPSITMYSPSSLYFTDDGPVLPIIYADPAGYQTDQQAPEIEVIWDDTIDGENGDQIPLMAVEEVGTLRILVAGTTFFSDFDYGKVAIFANVQLFENFLDWVVDRETGNVPNIDEVGPRIGDVEWTPETATFTATVADPGGVDTVFLHVTNETGTYVYEMTSTGDSYSLNLPDSYGGAASVAVVATDNVGNTCVRSAFDISWTVTPAGIPYVALMAAVGVLILVGLVIFIVRRR